ncbi:MAG: hypothetical protein KAR40_05990 [Candidatus Sabulitectum sp.]|nr:hypothetical protein [Candidatus Sabulitectum sp.]
MDIVELTIEKVSGVCASVCGTEEVLKTEMDNWEKFEKRSLEQRLQSDLIDQDRVNPEEFMIRTVVGFANDACRSQLTLKYRYHDVVGMSVVRT